MGPDKEAGGRSGRCELQFGKGGAAIDGGGRGRWLSPVGMAPRVKLWPWPVRAPPALAPALRAAPGPKAEEEEEKGLSAEEVAAGTLGAASPEALNETGFAP